MLQDGSLGLNRYSRSCVGLSGTDRKLDRSTGNDKGKNQTPAGSPEGWTIRWKNLTGGDLSQNEKQVLEHGA